MQTRGGQGPRAANPISSWPVGARGATPVPKLVWWVKLVAELEPGVVTETEVARIERGEAIGLADLGLRLEEGKRLTAALQAEIVPAQVATVGERRRGAPKPVAGRSPTRRSSDLLARGSEGSEAGAETGVAGEAGGGAGARGGDGDRSCPDRARRGGRSGRSRAPAGGGEAAHRGAAGRDRAGTGGHGGRAPPGSTQTRSGQGARPPLR